MTKSNQVVSTTTTTSASKCECINANGTDTFYTKQGVEIDVTEDAVRSLDEIIADLKESLAEGEILSDNEDVIPSDERKYVQMNIGNGKCEHSFYTNMEINSHKDGLLRELLKSVANAYNREHLNDSDIDDMFGNIHSRMIVFDKDSKTYFFSKYIIYNKLLSDNYMFKYYFCDISSTLYKSKQLMYNQYHGYPSEYYHTIREGDKMYRLDISYDNHCDNKSYKYIYLDEKLSEEEFAKVALKWKRKIVRENTYNPIYMDISVAQEELYVSTYNDGKCKDLGIDIINGESYVTRKRK